MTLVALIHHQKEKNLRQLCRILMEKKIDQIAAAVHQMQMPTIFIVIRRLLHCIRAAFDKYFRCDELIIVFMCTLLRENKEKTTTNRYRLWSPLSKLNYWTTPKLKFNLTPHSIFTDMTDKTNKLHSFF